MFGLVVGITGVAGLTDTFVPVVHEVELPDVQGMLATLLSVLAFPSFVLQLPDEHYVVTLVVVLLKYFGRLTPYGEVDKQGFVLPS